jgi:IS5 family transposase
VHAKQFKHLRRVLKGQTDDALHVLCAGDYSLRWMLRAIIRLGIKPIFFVLMVQRLFVDFALMPVPSYCSRAYLQVTE